MREMHFFKKAVQTEIPSLKEPEEATAQDLFCFLFGVGEWSQTCPLVYTSGQGGEKTIYLLFREFAFVGEDFWQIFGAYFYLINKRWKVDIFGTTFPVQETVWLTLEERDSCCYGVQNTISGKEPETIHSLCLQISGSSSEEMDILESLLRASDWRTGILASEWEYHDFFVKEKIENPWENSCFCYGIVLDDVSPSDYLNTLTFHQKTVLWEGFLRDGFDYKEFEWLYQAISEGILDNRIEWELALHTAMKELGYTIQVSEHEFELYDAESKRRYLNFDSRQYAQRALLKMLFPINI